jgi:hypothetical protein
LKKNYTYDDKAHYFDSYQKHWIENNNLNLKTLKIDVNSLYLTLSEKMNLLKTSNNLFEIKECMDNTFTLKVDEVLNNRD